MRCTTIITALCAPIIGIVVALTTGPSASAQDAYGSSCQNPYRTEFQISAGASAGQPVRIPLTAADMHPSYSWSNDGDDILVTDASGNQLSHFVALWDQTARTGTIWAELSSGGAQTLYVYHGGDGANSRRNSTFDRGDGLEIHTRNASGGVDPTSFAEAQAAWDATADGQSGYGIVTKRAAESIDGNDVPGNDDTSFAMKICTLFEVESNEVGTWDIRAFLDAGEGGDMRVNGVTVDSEWNDDLWWGGNANNLTEGLVADVTLEQGWHLLQVFVYEQCCDGPGAIYVDKPNTGLVLLDDGASGSSRTEMEIVSCEAAEVVATRVSIQACGAQIGVSKTVELVSDPINGGTDPAAIPGAVKRYTVQTTNSGSTEADDGSLVLTDAVPAGLKIVVGPADSFTFEDGVIASGMSFTYGGVGSATDDVAFSIDGVNFNYTPTADGDGADSLITHIRFTPGGAFSSSNLGDPSFRLLYRAVVQ